MWAEADVRRAFDQFGSDPEANGSDGSSFVMNLTVFGIPTPVTGARKAIGSKLRCFRTGTDQRTCTVNVSLETKKFTRLLREIPVKNRESWGRRVNTRENCRVNFFAGFLPRRQRLAVPVQRSYLVDPASSHMLVSKIKPCMSKHKLLHSEAANGSLGHP
jgi:hypothetical protein